MIAHPGAEAPAAAVPGRALRVAIFTGNYNYIVDGVSRTLNRLVAHLEGRGHRVLVFGSASRRTALPHAGTFVPVPAVPIPGRGEYCFSLGLPRSGRRRLLDFGPDLIHVATPDLLGFAALRLARRRGIPAVASYHTHYTSYFRYYRASWLEPLVWRLLRRFYGRCREVYVPSESMIAQLRAQGLGANLRLWTRGVDTQAFDPRFRSLAWRRGVGIADGEVVVSLVSRLVKEKGLDAFVRAIEELERRGLPHRSLVVGDGPERAALERRLPRTIFVGHLEGEALSRAYASADVFVFPSDTETFGNVTLEALASGLPAVCADATGSRSLIEQGVNGYLCPAGELGAWTARLVADPALRARMAVAARAGAARLTWDAAMAAIEARYLAIAGAP
jgi:glycosyltransferase involved in cell wall biosynthesis